MAMSNTFSLDQSFSTSQPMQTWSSLTNSPIWEGDGYSTVQQQIGAGTATQASCSPNHPAPLDDQPNYYPIYEAFPSPDLFSVPSSSHSPFSSASPLSPHTPPITDYFLDNNQWKISSEDLTTDFPGLFFGHFGDGRPQIDVPLPKDHHEEFFNTYPGLQGDAPGGGIGFHEEPEGYCHPQSMQPRPHLHQPGYGHPAFPELDTFRPFLCSTEEEVFQHAAMFRAFRAQQEASNTQMSIVGPQSSNLLPDVPLNKKRRVNPQQSHTGAEYFRNCLAKKDPSAREAEASTFPMHNLQFQALVGDHWPPYDPSFMPPLIEAAPVAGPSSLKRTRADFEGNLEAVTFPERNNNPARHEPHTKDNNVKPEWILCRWKSCLTRIQNSQAALTAHFKSKHSEYANAEQDIKCVWVGCDSKTPIRKAQFTRHILQKVGHALSMNPADTTGQPKRYYCGIGACTANTTTAFSLKRHQSTCRGEAKSG